MSDNEKLALAAKEAGNVAYKAKDFETAHKEYDRAIELNPSEMTFINNKAAVYFEQKEYEKCVKECEKAVDVGRENRADYKLIAKAFSRMAGAYRQLGDLENAKVYYQKSLSEHRVPDTVTKLSEIDKILKDRERLAYINPEKSLEEKTKGNELFQKGDYPTALKHYSEAIKRNPDDAKLYSNRAACYQKLAEFPLALKDCEKCIELEPTFVRGHLRKGYAQLALKEFSKAQDTFMQALDLDPNCGEAQDGYRKCIQAMGEDPEERRKRAMNDPEVQGILSDPAMRLILEQMQSDPKALQEHLKNPQVAAKIEKLLQSGIIGFR